MIQSSVVNLWIAKDPVFAGQSVDSQGSSLWTICGQPRIQSLLGNMWLAKDLVFAGQSLASQGSCLHWTICG